MKIRVPGRNGLHLPEHLAKGPKVALAYPHGNSVTVPFHHSVLALHLYDLTRPHRLGQEPLLEHSSFNPEGGLYVEDNRQRIAEKFFAKPEKPEWLLQIDTDINFPPTLIETLLAIAGRDKKVLAASVPLAVTMETGSILPSCAVMMTDMPGVWRFLSPQDISPEGTEVDGVATAVALIHRDVIEAIADREGQAWFLRKAAARLDREPSRVAWLGDGPSRDRQYINQGEDLAFCLRAKEAGHKIWCARVPGLRHLKTMPLSHDFEGVRPATETPAHGDFGLMGAQ